MRVDLVLRGGRVIDPETAFDQIADVAIKDEQIVAVGPDLTFQGPTIDSSGLVVCPGFVDLHSHAQSLAGARLQVLDGVTTALDLECGALPPRLWYRQVAGEGRPLNFGFSASWALARAVAQGIDTQELPDATTPFAAFQALSRDSRWTRPLTEPERRRLCDVLEAAVEEGAVGIGVLLGYAPAAAVDEIEAVAALSRRLDSAMFVHSRSSARSGAVTALDAVSELVVLADRTGAHVHLCHLNSTSSTWLGEIVALIDGARERGLRVTTEAYPYSRGSTVVGAAFLSSDELHREGRDPDSLTYLATGEAIADAARLEQLRQEDPGGLVLTTTYDERDSAESAMFDFALSVPHSAFASDAMPVAPEVGPEVWPLPDAALAHPRSAGCFTKVLRWVVRERRLVSLSDAIRRCTLVPADMARDAAPALRRKGRLQTGADADVIAFDPLTVSDRADYSRLRPSSGVEHVIVGGAPVVRDGVLLTQSLPGRAITSRRSGRARARSHERRNLSRSPV